MAGPPTHIDLRAASQASSRPPLRSPLRSPRPHIAGDVPPELSPLDAFALHSRMLAKQLEDSKTQRGRRVSRLPPLNASSPLIVQARSDYFRSISHDSATTDPNDPGEQESNDGLGLRTEIEDPFGDDRPVSMHPRMSGVPPPAFSDEPVPELPRDFHPEGRPMEKAGDSPALDTGADISPVSPVSMDDDLSPLRHVVSTDDASIHISPSKDTSGPSPFIQDDSVPFSPSPEQLPAQGETFDFLGLAPPRPPFQKRPSSTLSSTLETTDEEGSASMTSSMYSLPPRKMSGGSHAPGSQPSLAFQQSKRSPSVSSELSSVFPRPSFNFSRPLSRASTPGLDFPILKSSLESPSPLAEADEPLAAPRSINSEFFDGNDDSKAAPSYIYSKFSLPRGKAVRRSVQPDGQPQNNWNQANNQAMHWGVPPSPPVRPSSSSSNKEDLPANFSVTGPSLDHTNSVGPAPQPSPNPSCPSTEGGWPSEDAPRGRAMTTNTHDTMRAKTAALSISTNDSASTLKASKSLHITPTSISEMTAEEHLAKGIECHESGSLSKSTYHLRLAARQNNPTAMLLYALACRHGWGMRVSEKEGVEWLRKAAECASLEIADDEDQVKEGKQVNALERKTRKAQFALSIYELGVSNLNGWGTEQDRPLALRCFEIAGSWGDVDALAEAGFCYAQGMGCKKDLKKAAKFYRMAEAKGMSMVGNSWIHKAKYNDDDGDKDSEGDLKIKKMRSKSRSRALFGRRPTN